MLKTCGQMAGVDSSWPCFVTSLQVETGMTYDRDQIRKWLLLGGSKCPLTGVQLVTRKVGSHQLGVSCSCAEPCLLLCDKAPPTILAGNILKGVVCLKEACSRILFVTGMLHQCQCVFLLQAGDLTQSPEAPHRAMGRFRRNS